MRTKTLFNIRFKMKRIAPLLLVALLTGFPARPQSKQVNEETLQPWTLRRTLTGHTTSVHSVAISPGGRIVASASWDRSIILWDGETSEKKLELKHGYHPHRVIFSPDGHYRRLLAVMSSIRGRVYFYDLLEKRWTGAINATGTIRDMAFSSDGKMLATAGYDDNAASIWTSPAP